MNTQDGAGYALLTSMSTKEEADVAASALKADGVEAIVANQYAASVDWGAVAAMGGVQVMVPAWQLEHARGLLADRRAEEDDDAESYDPARRRDRWKAQILAVWIVGPLAVAGIALAGAIVYRGVMGWMHLLLG